MINEEHEVKNYFVFFFFVSRLKQEPQRDLHFARVG